MLFYFLLVGDERRPLGSFGFHQFTTTIIENKGHRTLGGLSATIIYSATSSTWSCSSSPPPSCGLLLLHSRRPSLLVIIGWHGGTHSWGEATRRRCNGNGLEEVIRGNGNREGRGGGRCFYLRKMKARSAQERASGFQGTD